MKNAQSFADDYIAFQAGCVSVFHVIDTASELLKAHGFTLLDSKQSHWHLHANQGYFFLHHELKSLIAFIVGKDDPTKVGFNIIGTHSDSPILRLRLNPRQNDGDYHRLLTQMHGGLIQRSWFDRPLILAGICYELERGKNKNLIWDKNCNLPKVKKRLVKSERPLAIIPDLAIHLDREKNRNGAINPEQMLAAYFGIATEGDDLGAKLYQTLGLEQKPDGFELSLAPFFPHVRLGVKGELIAGPRHDDLAMVFAGLRSLTACADKTEPTKTAVLGIFDSEECGSIRPGGAHSSFLRDVLSRITLEHPHATKTAHASESLTRSFAISADMAHAFHPSFPDRHDIAHRPIINRGLVLKEDANDHYATSGYGAAVFRGICESAGVRLQNFIPRQDLGCGSTIGPFVAAGLNCTTVDVGAPMWAMHSTTETMGTEDLLSSAKAFTCFFAGNN